MFKSLIYIEFRAWFGLVTSSKIDKDAKAQMAASFGQMNQEISIDMMYSILYSIINHTVGDPKTRFRRKEDECYLSDFKTAYKDYDFKNKNTTNMDYIMMIGDKPDKQKEEEEENEV